VDEIQSKKNLISFWHGMLTAPTSITETSRVESNEFRDKMKSACQKQAAWLESDTFKELSDVCTFIELFITLTTIYNTSMYKAGGKGFAEFVAKKLYDVYCSDQHLEKAAQLRGLPDGHFVPARSKFTPQIPHHNSSKNGRAGDIFISLLEDHAKVIMRGMGRRGNAAINQEGAWRGFICRQLNQSLPDNIPNRYATIAELALLAGISVSRVQARSLIMKGRT
jgi:hypothetical protein